MTLRISSGIYKGRTLKSMPGKSFRPLSERVKLALFSIILSQIPGADFLDLFAGTGNVGIEALSRGAASVTLVEKDPARLKLINQNIEHLGIADKIKLVSSDVFRYFPNRKFKIVFAGPPYRADISSDILKHVIEAEMLEQNSLFVLQRHYKEQVDTTGFKKIDERKYGITAIDFYILSS